MPGAEEALRFRRWDSGRQVADRIDALERLRHVIGVVKVELEVARRDDFVARFGQLSRQNAPEDAAAAGQEDAHELVGASELTEAPAIAQLDALLDLRRLFGQELGFALQPRQRRWSL